MTAQILIYNNKEREKKKQNEKKTLTPATLNGHIWWNDRNHWANLGKKAAYFHCSHKCSSRQLHQCHRNIPHWSESHARVRLTFVSIECYRRSAVAPDRDLIKKKDWYKFCTQNNEWLWLTDNFLDNKLECALKLTANYTTHRMANACDRIGLQTSRLQHIYISRKTATGVACVVHHWHVAWRTADRRIVHEK